MVHGVNTKGVPSSRTESAKRQMIRKKRRNHITVYMKIHKGKPTRQITLVCMFTCRAYKKRRGSTRKDEIGGNTTPKTFGSMSQYM